MLMFVLFVGFPVVGRYAARNLGMLIDENLMLGKLSNSSCQRQSLMAPVFSLGFGCLAAIPKGETCPNGAISVKERMHKEHVSMLRVVR